MQNTEQRWFNQADKDHALIFAELLALADGQLGGEKSDPARVVMVCGQIRHRTADAAFRRLRDVQDERCAAHSAHLVRK